jgi:serine/threonine protein kinase
MSARPEPKKPAATTTPVPQRPHTGVPGNPVKGGAARPSKGASVDIEPGQLFAGRYRIEKQVGRGGMGAVYLAEQEPLARKVAIKVLHGTADETIVARFQREARLIAQLQHPHIVGLIDFGEDDGRLFLVMEYIDGEPLTNILKREAPLPPRRACEIALQIAEALAVAHDMHVVHRDVKPDNAMVIKTAGGQDFVKMLDFGVAKIKREGDAQNTIETKAGLIVGSLRYISPEQVESGDITPATDLYSFGCILYEMLTGRRVFEYPSPADCAIAHLTEKPKPPTIDKRPLVGPMVDFVMRCLEKKQGKRPADAREALKVLMACREDPARLVGEAPPQEEHTVAVVAGGLDKAQGARTMEVQPAQAPTQTPPSRQVPRPSTDTSMGAGGMPDLQLRRPSGAHRFDIVGGASGALEGHTSTSYEGVRLLAKQPAHGAKNRWWLWFMLALVIGGAAVAAVFIAMANKGTDVQAGPGNPIELEGATATAEPPGETPGKTSTSDVTGASSATVVGGDDVTVGQDGSGDAAAANDAQVEVAADGTGAATPDLELTKGTRLITEPTGADVLRDRKPICKTPCLLQWSIDEKPPLVRLTLPGHIDIDLQLVRGDHGSEQRFQLRKSGP